MYSIRATFLNLVLKGHPTWLHWIDDRDTVKITGSKRPVPKRLVQESLKNAFLFAVNKNQASISMVYVFSIQDLFMPKNSDLLTKDKFLVNQKTHCTNPATCQTYIPQSTILWQKYVEKWCIEGYLSYALWYLWDRWIIHNFTFSDF